MKTATSPRTLKLTPEMNGAMMTAREFDAVEDYEEGWRYELIRGVLVVTQIPLDAHIGPNEYLGYLLLAYQAQHPQGAALDLTLPERYVRTPETRRLADRVLWAGLGRKPRTRVDVPTVAVEFVSAGRRNILRDYEVKRQEYLAAGVTEYWVIDRFQRTLTVFRRKHPVKRVVREAETYRTPLLPGFELRLAEVLRVADQLEETGDD